MSSIRTPRHTELVARPDAHLITEVYVALAKARKDARRPLSSTELVERVLLMFDEYTPQALRYRPTTREIEEALAWLFTQQKGPSPVGIVDWEVPPGRHLSGRRS